MGDGSDDTISKEETPTPQDSEERDPSGDSTSGAGAADPGGGSSGYDVDASSTKNASFADFAGADDSGHAAGDLKNFFDAGTLAANTSDVQLNFRDMPSDWQDAYLRGDLPPWIQVSADGKISIVGEEQVVIDKPPDDPVVGKPPEEPITITLNPTFNPETKKSFLDTLPRQVAIGEPVNEVPISEPLNLVPDNVERPVPPLEMLQPLGLGLHNLAFNDLSWLNNPASRPYWEALLPRRGKPLDRWLVKLDEPAGALPSQLTPRLQTFLAQESRGNSLTWLSQNGEPIQFQPDPASPVKRAFTADELLSIDGLVRRYRVNEASLSPSELQLLREAAKIHLHSTTPTAPFTSYSVPGRQKPFIGERRFVVRVNVDPSADLDVSQPNAFNRGEYKLTNVEETEVLVVGDQSGRIISVQTVESLQRGGRSWIFENAGVIRWGGRLLIVAGVGYSGYRIASASPNERPRVIGEEVGSHVGGLAVGALATTGCVAFGIVTEGVGLFMCGLVGGAAGGSAGSYVGGAFASGDSTQRWVEEGARRDYEHFKQLNPDATPADYDRLQQAQEDFDAWGLP